jgi:hypothetical protein
VKNISLQKCQMPPRFSRESRTFRFAAQFFRTAVALALLISAAAEIRAQSASELVGRVEGHDFVVENSIGEPVPAGELAEHLSSGNRLVVRSGQARIILEGGGDILICGAAQLELLKAQGAITIALDHGTLRVHVRKSDPVSVFTPLVLATTVSIGGGERDVTVGLEPSGEMCIRAKSGAVRIGQQLSGESLIVPQFGGLTLSGGQISAVSASAPGCTCEADVAKLAPPRANVTQIVPGENIAIADPSPHFSTQQIGAPLPQASSTSNADVPPVVDNSTVTMLMPPLVFNVSSPDEPDDAALETIALARSVRVREDTVIHGTVEPKGTPGSTSAAKKKSGISEFFRRLFGGSP